MNVPLTPVRFLRYAREQYPDNTAVVCGGQRFTYAQFADRVGRLASALRNYGVSAGDRIAFLSFNCHRLLEAYYGVLEAGAILLPLSVKLSANELTDILNDSGATLVFVDAELVDIVDSFYNKVPAVKHYIVLDGVPARSWLAPKSYEDLLAAESPYCPDLMQFDEDAVAELFYTSGATAAPKGVMLTHRNVYLHGLNAALAFNVTATDAHLHTIPLYHANSWGAAHVITLMGGKHVLMRTFEPGEALRLIARERVRTCLLDPDMAAALVRAPERHECELSSLKWVAIGGAASTPALVSEVRRKLGCDCFSGYGLTETAPVLAISRRRPGVQWKDEERDARQAMTGYAIPGVQTRILDAAGVDVPHDGQTIGEIVVRSDGVMKGYWRQDEATARAMPDGWLRTGDLATIDACGYVSIVDRQEDVILIGGNQISSLELECELKTHPSVQDAAVIAQPDTQCGEVAKAVVALKPGRQVTEHELLEFCRDRMPDYKAPRVVEFVAALPKSAAGKTLKRALRTQRTAEQRDVVRTAARLSDAPLSQSAATMD